jgi:hypothetical protein
VSSLPIFDMIDTTLDQLEDALSACGLPLTLHSGAYERIGSGAWHDAYKVTVPQHAHPFIVRIRKTVAYGEPQSFDENEHDWHAEYVSASLYYMQANKAFPGICPTAFLYHVSPKLTCTVETYMGERLDLSRLDATHARRLGRQIGTMMHRMHQKKTHISGSGELAWDGANLYGKEPQRHPLLVRKIEQSYNENILTALIEDGLPIRAAHMRAKLVAAQAIRDVDEPVVLINRDVSPENLTVRPGNRIGIIDPYPYLGNGTRFAAWFIHCYRFLLPAYAQTERYATNRYDQYAPVLAMIADGFEKGYMQGDYVLAAHIAAERWLWSLEQAYDDLMRLRASDLSNRQIIKHGKTDVVRKRLNRALRELDTLEF